MVSQKYRWDFIGLSTDTKPTSETSEKVVNGSTFYCSDTSKLYVYCDGTWYERKPLGGGGGGGGPTVVQTTGTSTTDVMSQNAVTSMVFADPSTKTKVNIGGSGVAANSIAIGRRAFSGENNNGESSVAIGSSANTYGGNNGVAIGNAARARSENAISIGNNAGHATTDTQYNGAISLGAYSEAHARGEMNIGSYNTAYGYNNSNYRLLTGLYDGQSAHDAATVAQGNKLMTAAPTTTDAGVLGQLWTDTTNMHTYQCTAISGNTYTWTQRW